MQRLSHLQAFNYLVADQDEMFAVEAYPGRVRVRQPAGDHLVVTNLYDHPDMRPLHGRRRLSDKMARVGWIEARICRDDSAGITDAWDWARRLLRDHSAPICRHEPHETTLWSVVADLTARRVAYSLGAPCRNSFREWRWPVAAD
jgi:hypothetical protein